MGYRYKGPPVKTVSRPGSRNGWWMDVCKVHGETPHQTPFGCEKCQRQRLLDAGLVKP